MSHPTGRVHPVAALFPMLAGDELKELAADIRERGLLHPIVLDRDGHILDGRNRLKACVMAGMAPRFTTYEGGDPTGYVLAVNITRRHLSKGQIAMVVARAELFVANNQGWQALAARKIGVSQSRIAKAAVVLAHAPDLADEVVAGTLPLDAAYEEAQENKLRNQSLKLMVAGLRDRYSDLADKVVAGEITSEEACDQAMQRDKEKAEARRNHEQAVMVSSRLLAQAVEYTATILAVPVSRQQIREMFDNRVTGKSLQVTAEVMRRGAANLLTLSEEWERSL